MAACTINLKGLMVVAHYDFWPEECETGCKDEVTVGGVFVLGRDETVDDDDDKCILHVLGPKEVLLVEEACMEDAKKTQRIGEEV